ncbi:hypothetical protein TanjilG_31029 [Lupinus angustifolius]|uniref:Uncharacterized protein n=1 Tax=Lupinus angustifolius TaxID=3871 RepID=A0A1J7GSX2_LUPAN|nr:hypothetical protein TanjilG_31029 [Lupinus angustifolius]
MKVTGKNKKKKRCLLPLSKFNDKEIEDGDEVNVPNTQQPQQQNQSEFEEAKEFHAQGDNLALVLVPRPCWCGHLCAPRLICLGQFSTPRPRWFGHLCASSLISVGQFSAPRPCCFGYSCAPGVVCLGQSSASWSCCFGHVCAPRAFCLGQFHKSVLGLLGHVVTMCYQFVRC